MSVMTIRTTIAIMFLAFAVACGGGKGDQKGGADKAKAAAAKKPDDGKKAKPTEPREAEEAPLPPKVQKAAKLAEAIEAKPEDADKILEENEMDREALEQLMFEIAKDPELAAAYESARAG